MLLLLLLLVCQSMFDVFARAARFASPTAAPSTYPLVKVDSDRPGWARSSTRHRQAAQRSWGVVVRRPATPSHLSSLCSAPPPPPSPGQVECVVVEWPSLCPVWAVAAAAALRPARRAPAPPSFSCGRACMFKGPAWLCSMPAESTLCFAVVASPLSLSVPLRPMDHRAHFPHSMQTHAHMHTRQPTCTVAAPRRLFACRVRARVRAAL